MQEEKIVCILFEAPYSTLFLAEKLFKLKKIISRVREAKLFFYLDGTHQLNQGQYSVNFDNIEQILTKIHQNHQHIEIYACSRCTAARGYIDLEKSDMENGRFISNKLIPFVKIVSINILGEFLKKGYRIIQI